MQPIQRFCKPVGSNDIQVTLKQNQSGEPVNRIVRNTTQSIFKNYEEQKTPQQVSERKEYHSSEMTYQNRKRAREEDSLPKEQKSRRLSIGSSPATVREQQVTREPVRARPRAHSTSTVENRTKIIVEHFLPMRGTVYLESIENGAKKYEGRINGYACTKMRIGDNLRLFDNRANWGILCKITSLDVFHSFQGMLESKGILNMLPQLEQKSRQLSKEQLMNEAVKIYKGFPGSNRVTTIGVVAIGVEFTKRIYTK